MRSFKQNRQGIIGPIIIGTVTIMLATGTWLIAMLITGNFVDTFSQMAVGPYTIELGESVRTQGAIVIVIIDVGMVIWMAVSAFRKESQESPIEF